MPETFLIGVHFNKKFIYTNYIFGSFLKERQQDPREFDWLRDKSYIFFYLRALLRSPLTLRRDLICQLLGQEGSCARCSHTAPQGSLALKFLLGNQHCGLISPLTLFSFLGYLSKVYQQSLKRCIFFMKKKFTAHSFYGLLIFIYNIKTNELLLYAIL